MLLAHYVANFHKVSLCLNCYMQSYIYVSQIKLVYSFLPIFCCLTHFLSALSINFWERYIKIAYYCGGFVNFSLQVCQFFASCLLRLGTYKFKIDKSSSWIKTFILYINISLFLFFFNYIFLVLSFLLSNIWVMYSFSSLLF